MKIIKHGIKPIGNIEVCKTCGCLFVYDDKDIKGNWDCYQDGYNYVLCPECKDKVKI